MFIERKHFSDSLNVWTGELEQFDFSDPRICHGGGKGSSGGGSTNTTTNTTTTTPPPQVMAAYEQALGMANSASSAPLQQYSGNTVAPFSGAQTQAFGTINSAQGTAQPYIDQAQSMISQGTQPLWNGVQQFSPSAVSQYQSPYTQQVLNSTMASEQNQDAQQQTALQGNAISSGAWGGDRAGVASAILSGQQDLANNQTNAGIENQGYTQALGEFNTQQQAQLGANEANDYLEQQGAFGLANLGNESLSTTLEGANAQEASGALQQAENQEQLNVPYENFLQQQAYPFQTSQFYADVAEGLGSQMGGSSNGSTTTPAASTASQAAGLGLGLGGLFGSALGSARGGRIGMARGGGAFGTRRGHFDVGGATLGSNGLINNPSSAPNLDATFIPVTQSARGKGLPNAQAPAPYKDTPIDPQTMASDMKGLGKIAKSLAKSENPDQFKPTDPGTNENPLDPDSGGGALGEEGESNPLDFASQGDLSGGPTGGLGGQVGDQTDGLNLIDPTSFNFDDGADALDDSAVDDGVDSIDGSLSGGGLDVGGANGAEDMAGADIGTDSSSGVFDGLFGSGGDEAAGGGLDSLFGGGGEGGLDSLFGSAGEAGAEEGGEEGGEDALESGAFSFFNRGGAAGALGTRRPRHYASGGMPGLDTIFGAENDKNLPENSSSPDTAGQIGGGIGGAVGSIWGPIGGIIGHAAGEDAGDMGEDIFNGNWGNVGEDFEIDSNPGHLMQAKYLRRGGRAHFDGGGQVGGQSPMMASSSGQQMPSQQSTVANMTPEQLQNMLLRTQPGTPQARQIQAALQQKRSMPNVGAQAQGGFGTQQSGGATLARGGMAGHYADGGDADDGIVIQEPAPDDLDDRINDVQADVANDDAVQPIPLSALSPPPAGSVPPGPRAAAAVPPPQVGAMGSNQAVASAAPPSYPPPPKNDSDIDSDYSSEEPPNTRAKAKPDPWLALSAAGFAMAAGKSPQAMANIGEGALAGINNYTQQQKEADSVNESADKLMSEAKLHRQELAKEQADMDYRNQALKQTGDYQQGELAARNRGLDQTAAYQQGELGIRQKQLEATQDKLANGTFDQPTLDNMADRYLAGDKSVVMGLGSGAAGTQNRVLLQRTIRQHAEDANMSASDITKALASYQGDISEQRTIGTRTGAIKVGSEAVNGAADLALEASKKVDRSQYSDLNLFDQNVARRTGDQNVVNFYIRNQTLANEYAAAQNPRGVPRQADKDHAMDMLSTGYSQGQYETAVSAVKAEIANIQKATGTVKQQTSGRGDQSSSSTAPVPPQPGMVRVTNPAGQSGWLSPDEAKQAVQNGWKVGQ